MKRFVLNALAVVSFSSAFVYLLNDSNPAASGNVAVSAVGAEQQSVAASGDKAAVPDATAVLPSEVSVADGVNFEAIKQRFGVVYDPMLVMALGEFSDEEIDAYNELHVLPFNRAVGSDCEELPDPQFADQFYKTCKTVRERPEHPYNELADPDLRLLAVHDAVAALLLGRRSLVEEERLTWYLRSAALSEKSGPLMALAERRYGSSYKLQAVDGQMARVAQPDAMVKRLALETVAGKLGDPRANPGRWRGALLRVSGEQSANALERADALVVKFLDEMADAQRRVTGSVQVQEIIDA